MMPVPVRRKRDRFLEKIGLKAKPKNKAIQYQEGPSAKEKKATKFLELKSSVGSSVSTVKELCDIENAPVYRGSVNNANEIVKAKETVRTEIQSMINSWKEMNSLHETEINKKRSKFTKSELDAQCEMLKQLNIEIQSVNNTQVVGFGGVVETGISFRKNYSYHQHGPSISEEQKRELNAIKAKDAELDVKLDLIGDLLSNLNTIAQGQKEEIKKQGEVLEEIDDKMVETGYNLGKVSRKIKDTLSKC